MMDWNYNGIWFDQIAPEKLVKRDFKEDKKSYLSFENIEYAILWHYKQSPKSFENILRSQHLLYLELNSSNIADFTDFNKYPQLKRLETHYCSKLERIEDLTPLHESLEWLHIDQSKKLQIKDEIAKLSNLKVLCLNNCGSISTLDFLRYLPNLIDFRFVNTNVLDGNLTPLIDHPNLKTVAFFDKRHYNLKSNAIDAVLEDRANENDFREYVYRGEYRTFKYK